MNLSPTSLPTKPNSAITSLTSLTALDFQAFYPSSLYATPSSPLHILTTLRETYISYTGDPFFSAIHHAPWFESLLLVEALVQFPLAVFLVFHLSSSKPTSWSAELAALAFSCLTAYGSVACCAELRQMSGDVVSEEQKKMLFWGTYFPFAVIRKLFVSESVVLG